MNVVVSGEVSSRLTRALVRDAGYGRAAHSADLRLLMCLLSFDSYFTKWLLIIFGLFESGAR